MRVPEPTETPIDISAPQVVSEFAEKGLKRLRASLKRQFTHSISAGAFVVFGCVFSLALVSSPSATLPYSVMLGIGLSIGFLMVNLSESPLFTEVNVIMPIVLLEREISWKLAVRYWLASYAGNITGSFFTALLIAAAGVLSPVLLSELVIVSSLKLLTPQNALGWAQVFLLGVLGNWILGMSSLIAARARLVIGKIFTIVFLVTLLVGSGFLHSTANVGYLALSVFGMPSSQWLGVVFWNIIPVSLGNLMGGAILVALLHWYAYGYRVSSTTEERTGEEAEPKNEEY